MKKNLFTALVTLLLLSGCQDDVVNKVSMAPSNINDEMNIVYPLSKTFKNKLPQTRGGFQSSFETNWENLKEITTAYGNKLNLPWDSESDGNTPYDLAIDIKKEDGWQLVFHTFNGTDVGARNRNYMAFYNQRTGIFKVFYYLINFAGNNNGGSWDLSFTTPQKLLNATLEFADPINMGEVNYWGCTNVVKEANKGFYEGWNCFQVPFAYDPNNNGDRRIEINSHLLNTTDLNLFGENNSYSQGTILTHGSTNPFSALTGDLASVVGKDAEKWVAEKFKKEVSSTRNSMVAGTAGAIVKFGANNILSRLTASFSKPTVTKSDLEFTTKGVTTTTGNLTFNSSGPVLSLRTLFNKEQVGELGTWNLTDQPTVYIDPRADYFPTENENFYREYWYKLRGISRYQYNLAINPELQSHIVKQWVDISLVRYFPESAAPTIPAYYTNFGGLGGNNNNRGFTESHFDEELIYGTLLGNNSIHKKDMRGRLYVKNLYGQYQGPIPIVLVPKVESYEAHHFNSKNIFMKMSLYLVTNFEGKQDTTLSTKTFIPKIEWDQSLYDKLKDVNMKDLQHYNHVK